MTAPPVYTKTAIALHWVIALLILVAFPLGIYMADLPLSPTKLKLFASHKSIGVTVFLFVLARVVWRLTHAVPAPPAGMPGWQQRAASITHGLLYVLILAVPLVGWLASSADGMQTVYFRVLPLPDLLPKDKALGEVLGKVHGAMAFTMALLVIAHIAASLKHHLVDRDDVLKRMLPWYKGPI